MKTGQMLFVAFGGILLGAGGTLAIQTGLVHYEVTLDIRPRGPLTLPPPALSLSAADPYSSQPTVQNWEPVPHPETLPVTMPPLDDHQIAEIVAVREQIGGSVAQKLTDLTGGSNEANSETFADHLRAAAGGNSSVNKLPEEDAQPADKDIAQPADKNTAECPECLQSGSSLARGLHEAHLR